MKPRYLLFMPVLRLFLLLTIVAVTNVCYGQIYSYTNDSVGNYNSVATNATGTALGRINTAVSPATACRYGFSSKNFPATAVFATTLPADTLSVAPNTGYTLSVTGFSVGLRRSNTGPDSARLAYTTNGGTTWINQGFAFSPKNAGCDTTITAVWTTTVTVTFPNHLEFAVFGYNASNVAGTFQVDTLTINGTVHMPTTQVGQTQIEGVDFAIYPNPVYQNATIAYHLSKEENVSVHISNMVGQEIYSIVNYGMQQEGDYKYPVPAIARGLYFVKITVGASSYTTKLIKL